MQKRILFVANDSMLYGANQSLLDLVATLKAKNAIELFIVFPKKNKEICKRLDAISCKYYIINYRTEIIGRSKHIRYLLINVLKFIYKNLINTLASYQLIRIVREEKINIIHSNSSVIAIGEQLARKEKIRHVWHLREYIGEAYDLRMFGKLATYKKRIKNSDQLIAISSSVAKDFDVANKAYIIHDAVVQKPNSFPQQKRNNYFLVCGTLRPLKGIETAIEAFHQFAKKQQTYKLLIAGTGETSYEVELKELANDLGLNDCVEFLGFQNDIQNLMLGAKALLMCSKNEGLGRVTIEAMLNNCPVIGYDNAGTSEIITNRETGLLFQNVDHLVEQMKYLILSPEEIETMKKNAYQYASKAFSEKNYADKIYTFYTELLA